MSVEECISLLGREQEEEKEESPKQVYVKSSILLPFCSVMDGLCEGIKKNHSLYTQCGKEVVVGTVLCKGCTRQKENSSTGTPPYGMIRDRDNMGPDYIDPKGNKAVPYANVAKRLGINIEDAKKEAEKLGLTIPESELIERASKRGRPKKVKSAATEEIAEKKKRGRPKKEEEKEKTKEDLIKQMAAELDDDIEEKYDTPEEKHDNEKYKDGEIVPLAGDFNGIVTRIDGAQYFITQGSPGDDDCEEYVWTIGEEAECIGIYEDGKIIEIEYDEE